MKVFHTGYTLKKKKPVQKQLTVTSGLKSNIMWYLSQYQMLMFLKLERMPTYEGHFLEVFMGNVKEL